MVEVVEYFVEFEPRLNYACSVRKVLATLPAEYLHGLEAVILRDEASLTRKERGRGRVNGLYVRDRRRKKPPRIELFLDNILSPIPGWLWWCSILRKEVVHSVLLHEVGHHLQATILPQRDTAEDEAWELAERLWQKSFRQRHPVLAFLASAVFGAQRKVTRPGAARN